MPTIRSTVQPRYTHHYIYYMSHRHLFESGANVDPKEDYGPGPHGEKVMENAEREMVERAKRTGKSFIKDRRFPVTEQEKNSYLPGPNTYDITKKTRDVSQA